MIIQVPVIRESIKHGKCQLYKELIGSSMILGALTLATSIPLLLLGFKNVAVLPGALVLAGISAGIL